MNNVQVRIGKLIGLFSLAIFLSKFIHISITNFDNLITFFTLQNFVYFIYFILFSTSTIWDSIYSKIIQILIILFEAIMSLTPEMTSPFFGLMMLIIAILLSYVYGFFIKYRISKIIISSIILYLIFVLLPLQNNIKRFLISAQWIIFIWTFLFMLWIIFKDLLDEVKSKDYEERDRLIKLMEETKCIAQDALNAYEKYFEKYKNNLKG